MKSFAFHLLLCSSYFLRSSKSFVLSFVWSSTILIILAGLPATTTPEGTSLTTTDPAAITEPLPIFTPSNITELAPIKTSSPISQGDLLGGSKTPATTAPAPKCTLLP